MKNVTERESSESMNINVKTTFFFWNAKKLMEEKV